MIYFFPLFHFSIKKIHVHAFDFLLHFISIILKTPIIIVVKLSITR